MNVFSSMQNWMKYFSTYSLQRKSIKFSEFFKSFTFTVAPPAATFNIKFHPFQVPSFISLHKMCPLLSLQKGSETFYSMWFVFDIWAQTMRLKQKHGKKKKSRTSFLSSLLLLRRFCLPQHFTNKPSSCQLSLLAELLKNSCVLQNMYIYSFSTAKKREAKECSA